MQKGKRYTITGYTDNPYEVIEISPTWGAVCRGLCGDIEYEKLINNKITPITNKYL